MMSCSNVFLLLLRNSTIVTGQCSDLMLNGTKISVQIDCKNANSPIVSLSSDWKCKNPITKNSCETVNGFPFTSFKVSEFCKTNEDTLSLRSNLNCDVEINENEQVKRRLLFFHHLGKSGLQ
jgi:hypothetical protein